MPACKKIKRKHRKVCIGDLDSLVTIRSRSSDFDECEPSASFSEHSTPWALVESVKGIKVFDETNTEVEATHRAIIEYDSAITAEFFLDFEGIRYRILSAEDLDVRNEWTELLLTSRGVTTKAVNDA